MINTDQTSLYEVALADGLTFRAEVVGEYNDGNSKDISCIISDGSRDIATEDLDEVCDSYDVTEWVKSNGGRFANETAEEVAACIIQHALIDREMTVGDAAIFAVNRHAS